MAQLDPKRQGTHGLAPSSLSTRTRLTGGRDDLSLRQDMSKGRMGSSREGNSKETQNMGARPPTHSLARVAQD